jgi:hypothetical protein
MSLCLDTPRGSGTASANDQDKAELRRPAGMKRVSSRIGTPRDAAIRAGDIAATTFQPVYGNQAAAKRFGCTSSLSRPPMRDNA